MSVSGSRQASIGVEGHASLSSVNAVATDGPRIEDGRRERRLTTCTVDQAVADLQASVHSVSSFGAIVLPGTHAYLGHFAPISEDDVWRAGHP